MMTKHNEHLQELLERLKHHERALELMEEAGADGVFNMLWDAAVPKFEAILAYNPETDSLETHLFSSSTRLHPDSELIILSNLPLGDSISSGIEEEMFSQDEWDEIMGEPYEGDERLWLEDHLKRNPGAYTWEERAENVFRFYYEEKHGFWDDIEGLREEIEDLEAEIEKQRTEALREIKDLQDEIWAAQEEIDMIRSEIGDLEYDIEVLENRERELQSDIDAYLEGIENIQGGDDMI